VGLLRCGGVMCCIGCGFDACSGCNVGVIIGGGYASCASVGKYIHICILMLLIYMIVYIH